METFSNIWITLSKFWKFSRILVNFSQKTISSSKDHNIALNAISDLVPLHFPISFPEVFLRFRLIDFSEADFGSKLVEEKSNSKHY